MIASHYAEPLKRRIGSSDLLRTGASCDAEILRELRPGEPFLILDDSLGWAWGYAGKERRVGYVPSGALAKNGSA